jgi:hypothetical protein
MLFKRTSLWNTSRQQANNYKSVGLPVIASLLAAYILIRVGTAVSDTKWPASWEFRHRIKAAGTNHGYPQFIYLIRGRIRHVPYTSSLGRFLHDGDSISKASNSNSVFVIRDSLTYRTITQWNWQEYEQDFSLIKRENLKR